MRFWLAIIPAFLAAYPAAVGASDRLPLKRGIFVEVGKPCRHVGRAAILSYWGADNAINDAHDRCRIDRLSRRGNIYALRRGCEVTEGPYEGVRKDRVIVSIRNASEFSLVTPDVPGWAREVRHFRYCAPKIDW